MSEEKAIAHFETLRQDTRDEIKKRIEQRDKYSIQMTIALGLIVTISFSTPYLGKVLMAAPLVSIYFTMLILYSYKIHDVLTQYLRDEIEPELARLCGTSPTKELETYYKTITMPGIRRKFFLWALWVVCLASLTYLWVAQREEFIITLAIVSLIYISAALTITIYFLKKHLKCPNRVTTRPKP